MTYICFKWDALTPSRGRTTFNNPPINLIDVRMVAELHELFARIERDEGPAVLINADPDYFLPYFDISPANLTELASLSPGPTGLDPWLDILVRLSMLPAVTISAIRGRARGAGSEFALASDMRFASRERAVLAQIGSDTAPFLEAAQHHGYLVSSAVDGHSKYYLVARTSTVNLLSGTGTSIVLFRMESSSPLCTASLVGSRPSIVRLWRILSTSSTRCLYRTRSSFRHSWIHSCGRRRVPGYWREPAKPSITDFRRAQMSNFVSRSILERSPKQSLLPANKAVVREIVRRRGEGIAMGAVGRRARFG